MEYRGYKLVGDGTFGMCLIKALGKGSVVLGLRGAYTNKRFAQRAIDAYEDEQLALKEKKNGKAKASSRD